MSTVVPRASESLHIFTTHMFLLDNKSGNCNNGSRDCESKVAGAGRSVSPTATSKISGFKLIEFARGGSVEVPLAEKDHSIGLEVGSHGIGKEEDIPDNFSGGDNAGTLDGKSSVANVFDKEVTFSSLELGEAISCIRAINDVRSIRADSVVGSGSHPKTGRSVAGVGFGEGRIHAIRSLEAGEESR